MDRAAIQRLAKAGESETIEFKKSTGQLYHAGETPASADGASADGKDLQEGYEYRNLVATNPAGWMLHAETDREGLQAGAAGRAF